MMRSIHGCVRRVVRVGAWMQSTQLVCTIVMTILRDGVGGRKSDARGSHAITGLFPRIIAKQHYLSFEARPIGGKQVDAMLDSKCARFVYAFTAMIRSPPAFAEAPAIASGAFVDTRSYKPSAELRSARRVGGTRSYEGVLQLVSRAFYGVAALRVVGR